jgi:hypothetical protein
LLHILQPLQAAAVEAAVEPESQLAVLALAAVAVEQVVAALLVNLFFQNLLIL